MAISKLGNALVLILALCTGANAEENKLKEGTREVGHAVGNAAREVGHGTKKVAKEIGHGVKVAARETGHAFRDGAKAVKQAVTPDNNAKTTGSKK